MILIILILTAGCRGGGTDIESGQDVTLKVMYHDKESFFQTYGELFIAKYPNVQLEVVPVPLTGLGQDLNAFTQLINEEKPDLLMLNLEQYAQWAHEGKLLSLNPLMKAHGFDMNDLSPLVMDVLNQAGGGEWYGLAPRYDAKALYYNKDLFDEYNIPYPEDGMSWEQVLMLAKRFSTAEGVHGFQYLRGSEPYYLAMAISQTYRLELISALSGELAVNTDGWKGVLQLIADAVQSRSLYLRQQDPNHSGNVDPFVMGKTAMAYTSSGLMYQLKRDSAFNWDLATVPVHPGYPDSTHDYSIREIFAIPSESGQVEAAWKLLEYIHSSEYTKLMSGSESERLFSRMEEMVKQDPDRHLAAFSQLKSANTGIDSGADQLPNEIKAIFNKLVREEFDAAIQGEKSVDEALRTIKDEGARLLPHKQKGDIHE